MPLPQSSADPFFPAPAPEPRCCSGGCCYVVVTVFLLGWVLDAPRPLPSGPPPLISTHHYFFFKDLFTIVRLLQLGVFILMGGVPHEAALHHRRLRHHLFCGRRQEAPLHAVQAANNIHSTWLPTPPPTRASCHHLFSQG